MSRTIKDSMDLLEQSLTDCKTALTEKGVADVEAIKISDVNEKIAEIQAGGGSSNVEFDSYGDYRKSCILFIEVGFLYVANLEGYRLSPSPKQVIGNLGNGGWFTDSKYVTFLAKYDLNDQPQDIYIRIDNRNIDDETTETYTGTISNVDMSKARIYAFRPTMNLQ